MSGNVELLVFPRVSDNQKDDSIHHSQGCRLYHDWLVPILSDPTSKRLFFYANLNLAFTFCEIGIGLSSGSLSLTNDGFHMLLDSGVLFVNLILFVISKWPPNSSYPYGYGRVQIIASLINSLFLVFICCLIALEALERLFHPKIIQVGFPFFVSILGLIINLIGLFSFGSEFHSSHGCQHQSDVNSICAGDSLRKPLLWQTKNNSPLSNHQQQQSHNNHCDAGGHFCGVSSESLPSVSEDSPLFYYSFKDEQSNSSKPRNLMFDSVYLHILSDTLGSLIVIFSTIAIYYSQYFWIDSVCSLLLSIFISFSLFPIVSSSINILMQTTPPEINPYVSQILAHIKTIPCVNNVNEFSVWKISDSHSLVACLKLSVSNSAKETPGLLLEQTQIKALVYRILYPWKFSALNIQIDDNHHNPCINDNHLCINNHNNHNDNNNISPTDYCIL